MITEKENIADSFYAFHDGIISFEKEEGSNQIWKIDCEYLAKIINLKFESFWIKIFDCQFLQLIPWMNPIELPQEIWITREEVFRTDLEISSAKVREGKIEIYCYQHNLNFNYSGGDLILQCKGIKIYDQEWNEIGEDKLVDICNKYWNKE